MMHTISVMKPKHSLLFLALAAPVAYATVVIIGVFVKNAMEQ